MQNNFVVKSYLKTLLEITSVELKNLVIMD